MRGPLPDTAPPTAALHPTLRGTLLFLLLLVALPLPLLAAHLAQFYPGTIEQMPYEGPTVRLAWFSKPPTDGDHQLLRSQFDLVILNSNDLEVANALREPGQSGTLLQYLRFDAIYRPERCDDQPRRNQVANRIGDFCRLEREHPDWFLRDREGDLILSDGEGDSYVMMDPGNREWQQFWIERALATQEELGWDGLFLDNVEGSLNKRERVGAMPAPYRHARQYRNAVRHFLAALQGALAPQGLRLYANIIDLESPNTWFDYLHYLDGAMDEAWVVGWGDDYLPPHEWEDELARAERSQARAKELILVAQGPERDEARQRFAYASYLLVNQGRAFFRYSASDAYDEMWLYNNYQYELGAPEGPRYRRGRLWKRDFELGSVSVDPVNHAATITIHTPTATEPGGAP